MGACDANFGDCNASAADGCETMLNTGSNCGACGAACNQLQACTGDDVAGYTCSETCVDADGDDFADVECGGPDCDDSNANVRPGAAETCNDVDDDCDGLVDEGFDADGDGYKSCGAQADCDDADPAVHPGAVEICDDGIDNDCVGGDDTDCACVDADHDGHDDAACGGDDCNDLDANTYPGAFERCDDVDNNCDGVVDEGDTCKGGIEGCSCSVSAEQRSGGWLLLGLFAGLALLRRRDRE
jgi:MYXO-CTERM domain-containing protein